MLMAELNRIVPLTANWMLSPGELNVISWRSEPGPVSASEVTVSTVAWRETAALIKNRYGAYFQKAAERHASAKGGCELKIDG